MKVTRLPELADLVAEHVQKLRHPADMILMRVCGDDELEQRLASRRLCQQAGVAQLRDQRGQLRGRRTVDHDRTAACW